MTTTQTALTHLVDQQARLVDQLDRERTDAEAECGMRLYWQGVREPYTRTIDRLTARLEVAKGHLKVVEGLLAAAE
nr:hypothetical protein [uncultured Lichenicoccus sp.]